MNILGISAFYHDSAAALVVDGDVVAAAQEERFSRKKHDAGFPTHAIDACLQMRGLTAADLDHVVFYDKPLQKFDRLLETAATMAPIGVRAFIKAMPPWLKQKLHLPREILAALSGYEGDILFTGHHESHAASAFFPSPFESAAVLCIDGVGEWTTTSYGVGSGNRVELRKEVKFPHSLGLLYSAFTYYTGFTVNSGEYKVMGLAPYGTPKYADRILDKLIDLREDGSFHLNMEYFNYCGGLTMTANGFDALFDAPRRDPDERVTQHTMDIAASIQQVTEEAMLRLARHIHSETGEENLCMAGGVALNCVGNGRILREGPFKNIFVQPAAGDAGGALGCALTVWHHYLDQPRTVHATDAQHGSLLGPDVDDDAARAYFDSIGAPYEEFDSHEAICEAAARELANENVVGWVQGRMEFGPRALGARSILGDPRSPKMQSILNLKIKFRESFRPFAPAILREHVTDYFELDVDSPYMLLVAPVNEARRIPMGPETAGLEGIELLKVPRSDVPCITHVDYSARVQTVDRVRNPLFHALISAFHKQSGCPIVVNTSFNIRGEPIVCTPQDAYRCFMFTHMDCLAVGRFLLRKEGQPELPGQKEYLAMIQND